jgi:hypothetical protein
MAPNARIIHDAAYACALSMLKSIVFPDNVEVSVYPEHQALFDLLYHSVSAAVEAGVIQHNREALRLNPCEN